MVAGSTTSPMVTVTGKMSTKQMLESILQTLSSFNERLEQVESFVAQYKLNQQNNYQVDCQQSFVAATKVVNNPCRFKQETVPPFSTACSPASHQQHKLESEQLYCSDYISPCFNNVNNSNISFLDQSFQLVTACNGTVGSSELEAARDRSSTMEHVEEEAVSNFESLSADDFLSLAGLFDVHG
jgi:hypothetical protein